MHDFALESHHDEASHFRGRFVFANPFRGSFCNYRRLSWHFVRVGDGLHEPARSRREWIASDRRFCRRLFAHRPNGVFLFAIRPAGKHAKRPTGDLCTRQRF